MEGGRKKIGMKKIKDRSIKSNQTCDRGKFPKDRRALRAESAS